MRRKVGGGRPCKVRAEGVGKVGKGGKEGLQSQRETGMDYVVSGDGELF